VVPTVDYCAQYRVVRQVLIVGLIEKQGRTVTVDQPKQDGDGDVVGLLGSSLTIFSSVVLPHPLTGEVAASRGVIENR